MARELLLMSADEVHSLEATHNPVCPERESGRSGTASMPGTSVRAKLRPTVRGPSE